MPSEKPVRPLHTLAYGETAVITSMYLHGAIRQRLQDHRHSRPLSAHRRWRRSYRIRGSRRRGRPAKVRCENDFGTIGKTAQRSVFAGISVQFLCFAGGIAICAVRCLRRRGTSELDSTSRSLLHRFCQCPQVFLVLRLDGGANGDGRLQHSDLLHGFQHCPHVLCGTGCP